MTGNQLTACRAALILLILLLVVFVYTSFSNGLDHDASVSHVSYGSHGNIPFPKRIVHLDLKGAPLKISYYEWFFPFLSSLNVDGILIEYEDSFPYSGRLSNISRRRGHYSLEDIENINQLAKMYRLEIIPLIQTFGHMEFVLKHKEFSNLRENYIEDDSICVSDPESLEIIQEMIRQVKQRHPKVSRIHIGSDEAYHVGEDARCQQQMQKLDSDPRRALEKLKIQHISRVARYCKELEFEEVFSWNDMFDKTAVDDLRELGSLITPVVWGYSTDVLKPGYFPEGLFYRLVSVFDRIWFASAFKGANGREQAFMSIDRYLQNHKSYVHLYRNFSSVMEGKIQGIMITGWQRYKHRFPLSELLPVAIPSLTVNSLYLNDVHRPFNAINRAAKEMLNCSSPPLKAVFSPVNIGNQTYFPQKDTFFVECAFHDQDLYKIIMKDYRLLKWKINNFGMDVRWRNGLGEDLERLSIELESILSRYYEKPDVQEILSQYLGPLRVQL